MNDTDRHAIWNAVAKLENDLECALPVNRLAWAAPPNPRQTKRVEPFPATRAALGPDQKESAEEIQ